MGKQAESQFVAGRCRCLASRGEPGFGARVLAHRVQAKRSRDKHGSRDKWARPLSLWLRVPSKLSF